MRSRLELSASLRAVWASVAVVLLFWGARGGTARFFASLVGFLAIVYAAGGGRVPWRIPWKDYALYLLISLSIIALVIIYAFSQASTGRQ